ncbi:MAG: glycosyltransferase [Melioribacter sp.]|nr:glycosyltransferase [Melioribacter sp.]
MKVLLLITKSEIGGAQIFVLNLAKELKRKGFDVVVAAGDGGFLFEELKKINIDHYYLKSLKRDISVINALYFMFDLYKLLVKNNFDILHLNSSNTLLAVIPAKVLRRRPKIVFTFHGLSLLDKNYKSFFLIKFISKLYFIFFSKFLDESVFVSEINYQEAKKNRVIKKGEVIYNGLNEEELNFCDKAEALDFLVKKCNFQFNNCFLIGSTGRLSYQKNYGFLIDNFFKIKKAIPNVKIVIIGEGILYNKLYNRIKELGLEKEIFLVGAVKDSYRYLKAFDLFTLPSRYEGLSISLLEAIYAGIPVLASDVGGNKEIVNNDTHQLYEFNNIDDYIEKLLYLKEYGKFVAEYNIGLRKKFNLDTMSERYISIYKRLTNLKR